MNEMQNYAPNEGMVPKTVSAEMMISRQAQEVQAAMIVAKRFPRDEVMSHNRILNACKRRSLAERAVYEYPRGGENVTGPSIRLAEVMAQNWGNLDFGITELEQKNGYADPLTDVGEVFGVWVIEGDEKLNDILPFKKAGLLDKVFVTPDMSPYKKRKVRILNGAHTGFVLGA